MNPDGVRDYAFWRALRPFSFVVAFFTCALGVLVAWQHGHTSLIRGGVIIAAALLLQAGVNLINDRGDLALLGQLASPLRRRILRNARWGSGCLALAALAGVWLSLQAGWMLVWLCLAGAVGALGYTLEPIHYKRRGLGVVLVFWFMGMLMVGGAYLAMSGHWSVNALYLAVPLSLLTALLLLSNELRDCEIDRRRGVGTLVVRLGLPAGQRLYLLLILSAYGSVLWLYGRGLTGSPLWMLPSLLLVPSLLGPLQGSSSGRGCLPPRTGRFFAGFAGLFLVAVAMRPPGL